MMKESYETLEMEVIAFDGEIYTETADGTDILPASGGSSPYQRPQ